VTNPRAGFTNDSDASRLEQRDELVEASLGCEFDSRPRSQADPVAESPSVPKDLEQAGSATLVELESDGLLKVLQIGLDVIAPE
jgi:hypothetical protein